MTVRSRDLKPGDVVHRHPGGPRRTVRVRKDDDSGWWLEGTGGLSDHVFDDGHWGWSLVESADEVTITVRRDDIERLLNDRKSRSMVVERIRAAIPAPEWEPTEEQIRQYLVAFPILTHLSVEVERRNKAKIVSGLKRLHKAGLL